MSKIICFSGAQGTGKTTMRNLLVDMFKNEGYKVECNYPGVNDSISRDAKEYGFVINEKTNFETQYYITAKYIASEILLHKKMNTFDGIAVLDRNILDILPYAAYAKNVSEEEYKFIVEMITSHHLMYKPDLIIYCKPIKNVLKGDGTRSTDVKFQLDIDKNFARLYEEEKYTSSKVIMLPGTKLETRMKLIDSALNRIL